MAELIGGEGKVAIVGHDQTQPTGIDRRDGFVTHGGEVPGHRDRRHPVRRRRPRCKSTEIAKTILAAHPDLKGIFGTNEGSAIGVVNAASETGKGKIVIDRLRLGHRAERGDQRRRDGRRHHAEPGRHRLRDVSRPPSRPSTARRLESIDTGFFWYDKTNIDDPEIAAVLYE